MECPHCRVQVLDQRSLRTEIEGLHEGTPEQIEIFGMKCPNESCGYPIVWMRRNIQGVMRGSLRVAYPRTTSRPVDPAVDPVFAKDYAEAADILSASPQASAAISRRILQSVLHEKGGYSAHDLAKQIDAFIADPNPSHIEKNLDYLREIGNFAAHPMKSTASGQVLPVEPGEAEWCLDVLDSLFDFYFVEPAKDAERRARFDEKLKDAGRNPIG